MSAIHDFFVFVLLTYRHHVSKEYHPNCVEFVGKKNRLQNILIPNWSLVRSTNTKGSQNVRKLYTMYSKSKVNTPVNVFVAWLDRHVPLSVKILSSSPRRLSKLLFSFFLLFFYPQYVATEITFDCTRFHICFYNLHSFCIYSFLFYFIEVIDIYAAVSLP